MDRPREKTQKGIKYYLAGGCALAIPFLSLSFGRSNTSGPAVQRQSVVIGTVTQGPMVFEVRGLGTMVPVDFEIISAQVACRVEQIRIYPGTWVRPDMDIAEHSSPELHQAAKDAHWQARH